MIILQYCSFILIQQVYILLWWYHNSVYVYSRLCTFVVTLIFLFISRLCFIVVMSQQGLSGACLSLLPVCVSLLQKFFFFFLLKFYIEDLTQVCVFVSCLCSIIHMSQYFLCLLIVFVLLWCHISYCIICPCSVVITSQ